MNSDLKIIFMGTADFAVPQLFKIYQKGYNIVAVVTVPDKPAGRGLKIVESPIKKAALSLNIPVLQPEKLSNTEFQKTLSEYNADMFIVVAFKMLPKMIWEMPKYGTINLHASLLPQYRGAAPINWAIINGEKKTGLTTFFINEKIDEGNIINSIEVDIDDFETAGELHDRLMHIGADLMIDTIEKVVSGKYEPLLQSSVDKITNLRYAPKIFKKDCQINWTEEGQKIVDFIRGLSPYTAAYTNVKTENSDNLTLKIFKAIFVSDAHISEKIGEVSTDNKSFIKIFVKNGYILLEEIQLEGKKRMKISDFLRGNKIISINF